MTKLRLSSHFLRAHRKYIKNNKKNNEAVKEALRTLVENPRHPGLNIEKLINSDVWSIRLSRGDRIFFTWINKDTALLLDIGKHDKYKTVV